MSPFGGGSDVPAASPQQSDLAHVFEQPAIDATSDEGLSYLMQEGGFKVKVLPKG